jgi:flagellar motility protein MotE (MotC chaperone)
MSVVCASCLQPINTGQRQFVLAGSEVFHRSCATNIANSHAARQRQRIVDLGAEAQKWRNEAERLARQLEDYARDLDGARASLRRSGDEVSRLGMTLLDTRSAQRAEIERRDATIADLTRQRENERLAKVYQATLVDPGVPAPAKTDDRDPTEVRFSLLELDQPK